MATSYVQEFKTTNDEEAALLAASRAASTVIDAADAIKVSRLVILHVKHISNYFNGFNLVFFSLLSSQ